jgi:GNAT superfamily N-acetyltransferase
MLGSVVVGSESATEKPEEVIADANDSGNHFPVYSFDFSHRDVAYVFRSLEKSELEVSLLDDFLRNLSAETKRMWSSEATARDMCEAVGMYDKLRMVATTTTTTTTTTKLSFNGSEIDNLVGDPAIEMVALFEFSMDLLDDELSRFLGYGIDLTTRVEENRDQHDDGEEKNKSQRNDYQLDGNSEHIRSCNDVCRFGPCLADRVQGIGLAAVLMNYMKTIARDCGKKRMILWGSVYPENEKAIRFYERQGFVSVGTFSDEYDGVREKLDMYMESI